MAEDDVRPSPNAGTHASQDGLPHPAELDPRAVRAVLGVIMLGTFIAPLDSSIVNIALPAISRQLSVQLADVGWVATAYLLTNATLVLTMGRLGDIVGLRKVYVAGLLLFGAGSLACALSPTLAALVAARVLQALGASMMLATGPGIISRSVRPERRGAALGMIALSVSAGLTAGPPLGGLLVGLFGWQSIFLVNIPIVLVAAFFAWRVLPDERPPREPFDLLGAALGGAALLALLLALSAAGRSGVASPAVLVSLAASAVLGWWFVRVERRREHPMLDLTLFESWQFAMGSVTAVLSYLALFAAAFLMPFYLLRVQALDPRVAGLILTAPPLSMALFAPLSGRLADRWGSRGLTTTGMALTAVALAWMSTFQPATSIPVVVGALLMLGAGTAVFQAPNSSAILGATPRHRLGVGSAIASEARNIGMVLGIGFTAAIVAAGLGESPLLSKVSRFTVAEAAVFVDAMRPALRFAVFVAATGSVLSWTRGPKETAPS